jgi:hypothetical protein
MFAPITIKVNEGESNTPCPDILLGLKNYLKPYVLLNFQEKLHLNSYQKLKDNKSNWHLDLKHVPLIT